MPSGRQTPGEWLTIAEMAAKLAYAPRTVRKKMHDGTWQKGVHWFKRDGCRPLFWWPAIVEWLRADEPAPDPAGAAFGADIPPARRGRPHGAVEFVPEES